MRDASVEDMRAGNAALDGEFTALDLRDHAALQDAGRLEFRDLVEGDPSDEGGLVVLVSEDTGDVREQDEFRRMTGDGDARRGRVRVDVVALVAVRTHGDRRDDRDHPAADGMEDDFGVDVLDLADEAVIEAVALVKLDRLDHVVVHTGEADRFAAGVVDELDEVLVDLAAEDRLDDVHGLFVGITQAVDEFALLAGLLQHGGDLRTAAVDDDDPDTDERQHDDVVDDRSAQFFRDHRVPAVLDDDGLAIVPLDVGQRLDEGLCPLFRRDVHVVDVVERIHSVIS